MGGHTGAVWVVGGHSGAVWVGGHSGAVWVGGHSGAVWVAIVVLYGWPYWCCVGYGWP